MSSLLKADTYYSEFGDPGAMYTYPGTVTQKVNKASRVTVYSKQSLGHVEASATKDTGLNSFVSPNLVSSFQVRGETDTGIILNLQTMKPVGPRIAKNTSSKFVYADWEYENEDRIHSLDSHSLVISGD